MNFFPRSVEPIEATQSCSCSTAGRSAGRSRMDYKSGPARSYYPQLLFWSSVGIFSSTVAVTVPIGELLEVGAIGIVALSFAAIGAICIALTKRIEILESLNRDRSHAYRELLRENDDLIVRNKYLQAERGNNSGAGDTTAELGNAKDTARSAVVVDFPIMEQNDERI